MYTLKDKTPQNRKERSGEVVNKKKEKEASRWKSYRSKMPRMKLIRQLRRSDAHTQPYKTKSNGKQDRSKRLR